MSSATPSTAFPILFQDGEVTVYNKPANLSLLRDRASEHNLWDTLRASGEKPYLVHRLDKGTSGVLLVARNQAAQSRMTRQFAESEVTKFYLARVRGAFPSGHTLHIDLPLCRGRKSRYRVAGQRDTIRREGNRFTVMPDRPGLTASTRVRSIDSAPDSSLLLVQPLSGRTHQIRVHLSWIGFPLLGDALYGREGHAANRLMLHCHGLQLAPYHRFKAPLPDEFRLR